MTTTGVHVTWSKLLAFMGTILIPAIGLIITIVIFGTRLDSKVNSILTEQDKQHIINAEFRTNFNSINISLDTLRSRQMQYHYENLIYQARKK